MNLKIYLKNNFLSLIILFSLIIWTVICGIQYGIHLSESKATYEKQALICENSTESWCELYEDEFKMPDTITIMFYILANSSLSYIQWLAPLFIMVAALPFFHTFLNSKFITYELTRESYPKTILKNIIIAVRKCFILPIMIIVLFLISFVLSGGNLNVEYSSALFLDIQFIHNIPFLLITYIIVLILHSIFYINIGLIFCKKNKSLITTIVKSYICFLILTILSEIFLGTFVSKVLHLKGYSSIFNLLGIWFYVDYPNLYSVIIYSIILAIGSFILVYWVYRNEEEVLTYAEK